MSDIEWTIKTVKLKDLKEYPNNPRVLNKIQAEHLSTSIEKFGLCEPLVANCDYTIIGGHQRARTLKKLKVKEAQVLFPSRPLTDKEVEELNIRLNKITGEFDWDILANAWDIEDLINWGFTLDEFQVLVEDDTKGEEKENSVELKENPKTNLGDLYILGDHRLKCGDSTNEEDVKDLLDGNIPILMVTDPPYGVNYDGDWRGDYKGGNIKKGKVENDDLIDWSSAFRLFPGDVAYVWHAGKYAAEVQKSIESINFQIISQIIWSKQNFAISRGDYHWKHEPCWYANRIGKKHNWQGSRKETTVWEIDHLSCFKLNSEKKDNTNHSTQKPIDCMLKPIQNNTSIGEGVYDPFVGSGTTLIASEISKRKSYCMEISPVYCDVIVQRWINHRKNNNQVFSVIKNGSLVDWDDKNTT